jgi:hypothetical protein
MGKEINFNHWKNAKYGDPKTHYTKVQIAPKQERTDALLDIVRKFEVDTSSKFSKICEFGCNNGRNLMPFYHLGIDVYGYDICESSLDASRGSMERCSDNFKNVDLFNQYSELAPIPDNYYDFSFTMGFLMHLPKSENKSSLINEIIRVSKNVLVYEPSQLGGIEESNSSQGGWHLSMMDYDECDSRFRQLDVTHTVPQNALMKVWFLQKEVL